MDGAESGAALLGGRYRLGTYLGGGGMADVYRATDTKLGREVAVKVFRSGTDETGRARFEEEARLLAYLNHPALVPMYDAKASGDEMYLVMQLVPGETLADVIDRGALPAERVAELGRRLCEVLRYVHDHGVVHRDVKPSNVLLAEDGRVFLADFGISRLAHAVGRMTGTGIVMGTTTYLAPEQVRGSEADFPVDIYALGLVLLECVTGEIEYPGAGAETVMARLSRSPRIPPELPEPLCSGLAAMTTADPRQRPTAAECVGLFSHDPESATAINALLKRNSLSSPGSTPVPEPEVATGMRRRVKTPALLPVLVAVAGLAFLVLVLVSADAGTEPPVSPLPPAEGPPGAARLSEDLANLDEVVRR